MTLTTLIETPKPTKAKKKPRPKSDKPAKAYKYGCLPPTTGLEAIHDQIWLAHKYRNKLCEIERIRRERTESVLIGYSRELVEINERIAALDDEISRHYDIIRAAKIAAKSRNAAPSENVEAVEQLKKGRSKLYEERKLIRSPLFKHTDLKDKLDRIDEQANEAIRKARSENELPWGTYLNVEKACKSMGKGATPRFRPWEPGGTVAVQIQDGMTMAEAFAGTSTWFRLEPIPADAWTHPRRGYRRKACQTKAWIRIGSTEKRKPIWAVIPVKLHRNIPKGGRIKWVKLREYYVGPTAKWALTLSVDFDEMPKPDDLAQHGHVGIDVGWRQQADGSLRVACWDGDDGEHDELVLDAGLIQRLEKISDLRSIRDKNRDRVIDSLVLWFESHKVPEAVKEQFSHLYLWKSISRLHKALKWWGENRYDGDEVGFDLLTAWAKQDGHLHYWEGHQYQRVQGHRLEVYRTFAAKMRQKYATIHVEKIRLDKMAKKPAAEEKDEMANLARRNRTYAAPSKLFDALRRSGANIVEVNPAYTSKTCSACGHVNRKLKSETEWVCPACLVIHDRDVNAAINIRRASAWVRPKKQSSLADEEA